MVRITIQLFYIQVSKTNFFKKAISNIFLDEQEAMGHVTDINTDGVKDSEQPEVIDTYKKDLAAKRKAEEEERLRLKA